MFSPVTKDAKGLVSSENISKTVNMYRATAEKGKLRAKKRSTPASLLKIYPTKASKYRNKCTSKQQTQPRKRYKSGNYPRTITKNRIGRRVLALNRW